MRQVVLALAISLCACASKTPAPADSNSTQKEDVAIEKTEADGLDNVVKNGHLPRVSAVNVTGATGAYSFSVELVTGDVGCSHYADWWDVVSEDGSTLHYRRILVHSHVDEQPFTRSGGTVAIAEDETVVVRLHMNTTGSNLNTMRGSVQDGFMPFVAESGFGTSLDPLDPQPSGCAF